MTQERILATLASGFGLLALVLACVGLYGLLHYSVARRTREIGIRMALGARPSTVIGSVMRRGLSVATVGLVAGCVFAVFAVRQIAGALYGIGGADPVSWLVATAILLADSALANLIPAWRAARVHPSEALRTE
jgi:ABC-type antimicrobial peptide transport system permease subunit